MAHRRGGKCAILAILVFALSPADRLGAEEFVSDQFGFRFAVPDGFYETPDHEPMILKDGTPMTVALFAEDAEAVDGYLITIHIQRLGKVISPFQWLAPDELPKVDGLTLTLETRHWQELELQAIRQDVARGFDVPFVGYLFQFPLRDEAVQIRVQGPKSRELEVLKTFNTSVESFVSTKPHIARIETTDGTWALLGATTFLIGCGLACVFGATFVLVAKRFRGSPEDGISSTSNLTAIVPSRGRRPIGVIIVGILHVLTGIWVVGHHVFVLSGLSSSAEGSVGFSGAFIANLGGDFLFSTLAIVSAVGLFIGVRWGWWLGSFYWCWRICNEVLRPFSVALLASQSVDSIAGESVDGPTAFGRLIFLALPLVYLNKASVLDYFQLRSSGRIWTILGLCGVALVLSVLLRQLIATVPYILIDSV